jgi:hypothetical protein
MQEGGGEEGERNVKKSTLIQTQVLETKYNCIYTQQNQING